MLLSNFKPIGNRLLVRVLRPAQSLESGTIVLPDILSEGPLLTCFVDCSDSYELSNTLEDRMAIVLNQGLIIHKYSGVDLEFEDAPGKKYKLLKPEEILLVVVA
jgi:co-chaperonin GroES (HSP10)